MKQVLISCAGLGMGNAARVTAIVESLLRLDSNLSIHIAAWGASHRFLQQYQKTHATAFDLIELEPYRSWSLLTFTHNISKLKRVMKSIRPDLVLLDSDYHWPAYWFSNATRVVLGQAEDVVSRAKACGYRWDSAIEGFSFLVKERFEAWVQRLFADWVLVPSFRVDPAPSLRRIQQIPLIVREEFLKDEAPAQQAVGVLLSGSELRQFDFKEAAQAGGFKILAPPPYPQAVTISKAKDFDDFDLVFTQGGLSSISEGLARNRFLVVFPLPDHAEQKLNALEVEKLGLGISASLDELKNLNCLMERVARHRRNAKKTVLRFDGADLAARFISERLQVSSKAQGALQTPAPC